MFAYLLGLILLGFGIRNHAAVLGETDIAVESSASADASTSAGTKPTGALRVMHPKFTAKEQEAFQKERAKREENLQRIGKLRVESLHADFAAKQKARIEKDKTTKSALEAKAKAFTDQKKKEKLLALSGKYQTSVAARLTAMQQKLESMSVLLDRITAAAGALKAQGKDVSVIESRISSAQAKVTSAITAVTDLASSTPTSFSIATEASAKEDVMKAIAALKAQLEPANTAFAQAHEAVKLALEGIEEYTDATEEAAE